MVGNNKDIILVYLCLPKAHVEASVSLLLINSYKQFLRNFQEKILRFEDRIGDIRTGVNVNLKKRHSHYFTREKKTFAHVMGRTSEGVVSKRSVWRFVKVSR